MRIDVVTEAIYQEMRPYKNFVDENAHQQALYRRIAHVAIESMGLTQEDIRKIVTRHIGNTFGSGDEVADDIYYHLMG